ncbi:MAG TPA: hypothetical protein VEH27_05915 [Methylomirabilota bacterium]|nr:hypothetical protein [Methylomirabilota bacterium]
MRAKGIITRFRIAVALIAGVLLFFAVQDPEGPLKVRFVGIATNAVGEVEYYFWCQNNAFEARINMNLRTLINNDHIRSRTHVGPKLAEGEAMIVPFVPPVDGPWHVRFACPRPPPFSGFAAWKHRINGYLPFTLFRRDSGPIVDTQEFEPASNMRENLPVFVASKYRERIFRGETAQEMAERAREYEEWRRRLR